MKKLLLLIALLLIPIGVYGASQATVFHPDTGDRKAVEVGNPGAFSGGYILEMSYGYLTLDGQQEDPLLGFSVISNYKTTLSASMTATQSTIPVSKITTKDGHTITMADLGERVFLTIEPGANKEEIAMCTGISGTSFTGCTRGLAFYGTSTASVLANRKTHSSGSTIVMSNVHYVYDEEVDKDTTETIGGVKTFTLSPIVPSPTTANQVASKSYVDGVAITGGATSTESVLGFVELATPTEMASSTYDVNNPRVLNTRYSSDNTRGFDLMEDQSTGGSDQTATTTTTYLAQTFKTTATTTRVTRLSLSLKETATMTGTTTVSLYSTSNDTPDSSLGIMGTVSSSTITSSYVTYDFDDLNLNVSPNKKYAIILSATGVDNTNYINSEYSNTSVYSDGNSLISYNSGTDWTASTTSDFVFRVYGNEPATDNTVIVSDDDGKLDQSWLDLTEDFSFSGENTFSATTTFTGVVVGANSFLFGNGNDGDVDITTGTTTLTRDMYYDNLTIDSDGEIVTAGYRIFVKGTLTNNGYITRNGNNGGVGGNGATSNSTNTSQGTAGTQLAFGTLFGGVAGELGGTGGAGGDASGSGSDQAGKAGGAGGAGNNSASSLGSNGGTGSAGGLGGLTYDGQSAGAVGAGGGAGTATASKNNIYNAVTAINLFEITAEATLQSLTSSAGEGGGGGGAGGGGYYGTSKVGGQGGAGGGSGSSGGIIAIYAETIINNGVVMSIGGNGGNGGDGGDGGDVSAGGGGGGAGGNGGAGGVILYLYETKTEVGTELVTGGTAGSKGIAGSNGAFLTPSDGNDGNNGQTGVIYNINFK